jgi:cobalt/nickel transport system permease protein
VWIALDAAAAPAVAYLARRAQRGFDDAKIPLLGVMGAFVFAAQMINFPVAAGASGHLVGGALLAITLGPAPAAITLTAILAIQALVFQDGGILALGANTLNMAVAGVLAGYLPYYLWGRGRRRRWAIVLAGFLSVLVSATLAVSELLISGIRIPAPVLTVSMLVFAGAGVLEGLITGAVIEALERIQPGFVRKPAPERRLAVGVTALAAVLLATAGVFFASAAPDGLEQLGEQAGIASRARNLIQSPFADYGAAFGGSGWAGKAAAGVAGLAIVSAACVLIGRAAARKGTR